MANQLKRSSSFKLFSLSSNEPLAQDIADFLGVQLGDLTTKQFSDKEISLNINESIRGCDVYLVQSTNYPVNDYLMEGLIAVDALKRASAKSINWVMPYYGYARQDRTTQPRDPITAKVVANMLEKVGVDRLITLDLHAPQVQGFFDIPVDHLSAIAVLVDHFKSLKFNEEETVVVATDHSGASRARELAEELHLPLAIMDNRNQGPDYKLEDLHVIGDVRGKQCIIFDDLVATGKTMAAVSQALVNDGASATYACVTHGVFSANAIQLIDESPLKKLVITDSILQDESKLSDKIEIAKVGSVLGDAIKRVYENRSMRALFDSDYVRDLHPDME